MKDPSVQGNIVKSSTASRRSIAGRMSGIRIPADLVITSKVFIALASNMADQYLEDVIEALVDELDRRAGDCDLEPEADGGVEDVIAAPVRGCRASIMAA